jgi:hypothetical protein
MIAKIIALILAVIALIELNKYIHIHHEFIWIVIAVICVMVFRLFVKIGFALAALALLTFIFPAYFWIFIIIGIIFLLRM